METVSDSGMIRGGNMKCPCKQMWKRVQFYFHKLSGSSSGEDNGK